ncbi:MAG: hypothetical protein JWM95_1589 [Gemmatimonadetes bacterium]|nr:hypothetical protein [Gemmatimonadota bacterium]
MKLFDVSWTDVLTDLQRWNALSYGARHALLEELTTHGYIMAEKFGAHLDEVMTSGIAVLEAGGTRLRMSDEHRALMKVLRSMDRHPVFDETTPAMLTQYMDEHFSAQDIEILGTHSHGHSRVLRTSMMARVAFAGWVSELLDADTDGARIAWASAVGRRPESMHSARGLATLATLHALAKSLLASPNGIPLRELATHDLPMVADAIFLGLDTLVLFVGMRKKDLEPMIGLWPNAVHELTRPPAPTPSFVEPVEQFTLAVQMEDMTTVLASVVAAPVRLRGSDYAVFARERATIEARMVPIPEWARDYTQHPQFNRVDVAVRELDTHRFIRIAQHEGSPHILPTPAGAKWLSLTPHDRVASLVDPIRKSKDTNPLGGYNTPDAARFFPFALPYHHTPRFLRLRERLVRAFMQASEGFIVLEDFLVHAEREANPLLDVGESEARELRHSIQVPGGDQRQIYRELWRSSLDEFFMVRLMGLGGAILGRTSTGELCFTLTDVGQYLLGTEKKFTYGSNERPDVVVQPNFDVVFLGVAHGTEAMFSRFAERVGIAPGLTFKLTRESVLRAAEQGATADQVVKVLRDASSKALPKNVVREIEGWMANVRRARLRTMHVIECSDAESADRAMAALGAAARRLTPMLIEVSAATTTARTAMTKRLRAAGVFLTAP